MTKSCFCLTILLICTFFFEVYADIYSFQFTPPEDVDSTGFAHYKLYVPDGIQSIKGVYCYVPGWQGNSTDVVNDTLFVNYASRHELGLMGFEMLGNYTNPDNGASLWSADALLLALDSLSVLSGHSEIKFAPLLFHGHSAGGQFSYHFTLLYPERVIAFVTMKGGYHMSGSAGDAVKVPGYLFIGENDRDYRVSNLTSIFTENRPDGAVWALAKEPGTGHERVSNTLIHSYFNAILPMRLKKNISYHLPVSLISINPTTGYLGNRVSGTIHSFAAYPYDKQKACWFPNEKIALEWQDFIQGDTNSGLHPSEFVHPQKVVLYQNHPNPFNPQTEIGYQISENSPVRLTILNNLGQEVARLVDELQLPGTYSVMFNLKQNQHFSLTSGVYFYRLESGKYHTTKKLIVMN